MLIVNNIVNAKKTEDLLCFVSDNRKKDEVYLRIIYFAKGEIVFIVFFEQLNLQSVFKIIMAILLKLAYNF